ncbi:CTU2 protein, partial [Piaya cayana]|nr:CTU2 protein [Piaya cayana]
PPVLPHDHPCSHSHPRACVKCKEGSAALVIRVGDAFCRGCFREYFVHKFRAMLGKNRIIFPGEKVLLALSGGPGSSAMLRQVQEVRAGVLGGAGGGGHSSSTPLTLHLCQGLSRETAKKLRFVPGLIYVDEGAVRGQNPAQREQSLAHMETLLQATGFPYYLAHLEEALELPASILRPGPVGSSEPSPNYKVAVEGFIQQQRQDGDGDGGTSVPNLGTQDTPAGTPATPRLPTAAQTQELQQLFEAVETPTAREELLQMLRIHLILQTARTKGYAKVMTGESCTRVAIKLLTNLALGRGAFLAVDTGFMDNRHGDVMVVRPMREYMAKEIAFYNHFFNVPTVIAPPLPTKRREKSSIHHLIERFLLGLQEDFPSTISTVYRTGEKLSPDPAKASSESERCLLCLCALDIAGGDRWETGAGRMPRQWGERLGQGECCASTTEGSCPHRAESRAAFIPLLCYGCRLTFKELVRLLECRRAALLRDGGPHLQPLLQGPLATLPPYVRAEGQRR